MNISATSPAYPTYTRKTCQHTTQYRTVLPSWTHPDGRIVTPNAIRCATCGAWAITLGAEPDASRAGSGGFAGMIESIVSELTRLGYKPPQNAI